MEVIIEEAIPEYAKERIEYSKRIGSETDNLSFGKEGFPISVEDEKEYIRAIGNDDKSVEYLEIIDLEVRSDNVRAIHLYQKFGFVKIGTFPKYFKIGNSYADCDIMYLDLQK